MSEDKESYFKYPKILNLYWDKSPLSFLNLLTVLSFNKYHNNWKINIYTPKNITKHKSWKTDEQKFKYTGKCYFNDLYKINNVEVKTVDLSRLGFYKNASEVIKSDYFRYYILNKQGGVWCDFDILFTSSIENKLNFKNNSIIFRITAENGPLMIIKGKKLKLQYYPIGFFVSMPDTPFFKFIMESCKEFYDGSDYQSIGANMFKKLFGVNEFRESKKLIEKIDNSVMICEDQNIYLPLHFNEISSIFKNNNYTIPKKNVGIHWFNGCEESKKYANKLDNRMNNFKINCFFDKLISDFVNEYINNPARTD